MGLLEYLAMPSLREIAHGCVHLLHNSNWAGIIGLNADSQLWEIETSETNHLIHGASERDKNTIIFF